MEMCVYGEVRKKTSSRDWHASAPYEIRDPTVSQNSTQDPILESVVENRDRDRWDEIGLSATRVSPPPDAAVV